MLEIENNLHLYIFSDSGFSFRKIATLRLEKNSECGLQRELRGQHDDHPRQRQQEGLRLHQHARVTVSIFA